MNDFLLFLISWVIGWVIYSIGYYIYDVYIDSQYDTIEYVQDGQGYNNINTGTQGDVLNGTKDEN